MTANKYLIVIRKEALAPVECVLRTMTESTRQVEGLFESLLAESFGG